MAEGDSSTILSAISAFLSFLAACCSAYIAFIALDIRPKLQASSIVFQLADGRNQGDYMITNVGRSSGKIMAHDVVVVLTDGPLGQIHPSRKKLEDGDHFWTRGSKPVIGSRQYEWTKQNELTKRGGIVETKPAGSVSYVSFLSDKPLTADDILHIKNGGRSLYVVGWFKYQATHCCGTEYYTRFTYMYDPHLDRLVPSNSPDWEGTT